MFGDGSKLRRAGFTQMQATDEMFFHLFAQLRAGLQQHGTIVADMDLMIASICLTNGCVFVTNNTKHFGKIPGLTLENWSITPKEP